MAALNWIFGSGRPVLRSLNSRIGKTAILFPVAGINAAAIGMISLGLIFYLTDVFKAEPAVVGLIAGVYSLSYFTGCLTLRSLSVVLRPRYSIMLSGGLNAILIVVVLLCRRLETLAVAYALVGFFMALFWPPLVGWLSAGIEGANLNKAISRYNLSWSAGAVISPYLAGFLAEINVRLPLETGAALLALVFVVVAVASLFLSRIRTDTHLEPRIVRGTRTKDASTPIRFPAWVSASVSYVSLGVITVVFPLFGRRSLGIGESGIGIVLLSRALAMTIGFLLLGRTTAWHFKRLPIPIGNLLLAACLLALIPIRSFTGYIILVPLMGLLLSYGYFASVFHGISGATQRAKRMTVHESLLTAGAVTGSSLGGLIYQTHGMETVFLSVAGLLLVSVAAEVVLFLAFRQSAVRSKDGACCTETDLQHKMAGS